MLPHLGPVVAAFSPSRAAMFRNMFTSSADGFRMRQVLSDLSNSVMSGRDSILRFSVRSHIDAFPRLLANGGRFNLPDDRDFYSDVLLAAAMPEDDFPAFTTATSILLMDLLQSGAGTDNLFWNWDSFEGHYRMADATVRAAIMNGFRLGFEMGTVKPDTPPSASDCLTSSLGSVQRVLIDRDHKELAEAVTGNVTAKRAGALWTQHTDSPDLSMLPGFRYLYERPASLTPPNQETAPLLPWS